MFQLIQLLLWHLFIGRRFYSETVFAPGKRAEVSSDARIAEVCSTSPSFPLYASEDEKLISIRIHGTDIFTYIWLRYMIDVGKYSIHGSFVDTMIWRISISTDRYPNVISDVSDELVPEPL